MSDRRLQILLSEGVSPNEVRAVATDLVKQAMQFMKNTYGDEQAIEWMLWMAHEAQLYADEQRVVR